MKLIWKSLKPCFIQTICIVLLLGSSGARLLAQEEPGGLKETLVLANQILAMEGVVGPFGHVSTRGAGPEAFLIADHRSPAEVRPEDILEVGVDVKLEEARDRHLYREVFIHSSIYRELPEVRAVVHTHSPYSVALGTLSHPEGKVLPSTNPGANLGNFIPIFSSVGLIDTPERAQELTRTLQGQNGVLLRGHGTVVVGQSLEQAVLRALYLEFESRSQIWSRGAGQPIPYQVPESDLFKHTRAIEHPWEYYLDKLKKLNGEDSR